MTSEKIEIVVIVDESGSMDTIRDDTIGGFNTFLAEQKALPGEANFTLVTFSDHWRVRQECIDLRAAAPMTRETFRPNGGTALNDAIGAMIDRVGKRLHETFAKPKKVIVAILTDGEENSSKVYSHAQVAEMIKHQREKYAWEFVYLGANHDAFKAAKSYNMNTAFADRYQATGVGVRAAYAGTSNLVGSLRAAP